MANRPDTKGWWPTLECEGNTSDMEDYGEAYDDFEEDNDDREVIPNE